MVLRRTFLLISFVLPAIAWGIPSLEKIIPEFEKQIQKGMQETHVPGVVVGVIIDNEVVYVKGFGVRRAGEKSLINPETVFQIASISKPIATTIIAALVGQHIVEWDSPITELDPSFQLQDPWISRHVTLRDFLCHRSGLPDHAGDLLEDLGFDRSSILYKLRLEPLSGFRAHYAYTNFGFSEAAFAAAQEAHLSWDKLVHEQLIIPLGMTSTSTRYVDFTKQSNRADLHIIQGGSAKPLHTRDPDAQSPAGGITTNMVDFTKWMLLQLSEGQYQGRQIISAEALKETHTPQITRGQDKFYGLGWNIDYNEHGNTVISHDGLFSTGAETAVKLIPKEKYGIAVFTNGSAAGLAAAIVDMFGDLIQTGHVEKKVVSIWQERFDILFPPPVSSFPTPQFSSSPLPSAAYIGSYSNDYFGKITISEKEGDLYLVIGPKPQSFLLTPLNRDAFSFETWGENRVGLTKLMFTVGSTGIATQLVIEAFNANGFGTFVRD